MPVSVLDLVRQTHQTPDMHTRNKKAFVTPLLWALASLSWLTKVLRNIAASSGGLHCRHGAHGAPLPGAGLDGLALKLAQRLRGKERSQIQRFGAVL